MSRHRILALCGLAATLILAVIDLVNGTQTARFAFGALRKGGKLVQVGLFGGELMLPLPIMAIRALTVQGSYVGNHLETQPGYPRTADSGRRAGRLAGTRRSHRGPVPRGAAKSQLRPRSRGPPTVLRIG